MEKINPLPPVPSTQQWQRLSPIAIVYFIIKFSLQFVKESFLSLAPLLAVYITQVQDKLLWAGIGGSALLLLMLLSSFLYYLNFQYRISDEQILVRKGVFKKERLTLNFGRVQNVNIASPFYFQPLKLVNCIFESAGSVRSEINLPGVTIDYANQLRDIVFHHKEQNSVEDDESTSNTAEDTKQSQPEGQLILALSNWESAKFGFTSNMMFILLAATASLLETIIEWFQQHIIPTLINVFTQLALNQWTAKALSISVIIVGLLAFILLLSVLGAWLRFFNYELYDQGKKLKRVSGLLERHQMSLSKHRIQAISIKQNLIALLLNRVTLVYHQVGANLFNGIAKGKQEFMIPMLPPDQMEPFLQKAFTPIEFGQVRFRRISTAFIRKHLLLDCFFPTAIVAIGCYVTDFSMWFALLTYLLAAAAVCLRYWRYGIWHNQEFCAIRSGFYGKTITLFPLFKLQQLQMSQTPLQKRVGLASIELQLACKRLSMPYLPEPYINHLINLGAYKAESSGQHWM